jgi:putative N6-adenine-specific DNA methylase
MKHLYNGDIFDISIKTLQHLEPLLSEELLAMGAQNIEQGKRIVHTKGDLKFLYRCNLELRTALRVLVPILKFDARSPDELYKKCLNYNWEGVLDIDQTFVIDTSVHSEQYKLPHFAALRMKDAIADFFKKGHGRRPDVNTEDPDVRFLLHIDEQKVTISLDSSGESLNRRGYRVSGGGAPLNEVLAAAMVMLAKVDFTKKLYIPMCGSGTIAIEAAYIAQNKPALWNREHFGFMKWENFELDLWKQVLEDCLTKFKDIPLKFHCSDVDRQAMTLAARHFKEAEIQAEVDLEQKDFFEMMPDSNQGTLILNPPYGERMTPDQVDFFYKRIGDHLKKNWPGHIGWIISSNLQALKNVGLKPNKRFSLMNGPLDCKFCSYELFRGDRAQFVKELKTGSL